MFSEEECVICCDGPPTVVFVPCKHHVTCGTCADRIMTAKLECPMCRSRIDSLSNAGMGASLPVMLSEVEQFDRDREPYLARLKAAMTGNAGFTGKNKQARAVSHAAGDELARRRTENEGADRCMAKQVKITQEDDTFTVTYKVGRKQRTETHPYFTWEELVEATREILDGDQLTMPDFAGFYPDLYWLGRHFGRVDELVTNKRHH